MAFCHCNVAMFRWVELAKFTWGKALFGASISMCMRIRRWNLCAKSLKNNMCTANRVLKHGQFKCQTKGPAKTSGQCAPFVGPIWSESTAARCEGKATLDFKIKRNKTDTQLQFILQILVFLQACPTQPPWIAPPLTVFSHARDYEAGPYDLIRSTPIFFTCFAGDAKDGQ